MVKQDVIGANFGVLPDDCALQDSTDFLEVLWHAMPDAIEAARIDPAPRFAAAAGHRHSISRRRQEPSAGRYPRRRVPVPASEQERRSR